MIENKITLNDIAEISREDGVLWSASIELTNLCNLSCVHCYISDEKNYGLAYGRIRELIDELRKEGTFNVTLTGGEIFLRKDILQIIEGARSSGLRVTLFSNATLLDEKTVAEIARLHVSLFSTTVFSLNERVNDSITGHSGSLRKTLANIDLLKKHGIRVEIKTPILSKNFSTYKDLRVYCEQNGYRFFPSPNIIPKLNGERTPLDYSLSDNEFGSTIRELKDRSLKEKEYVENYYGADQPLCPPIRNSLFISSNGNVYPCVSWPYRLGNICEKPLHEIWRESEELAFLRSLSKKDMNECPSCQFRDVCAICPGDSYLDGDMFGCSQLQKRCAVALKGLI